MFLGSAPGAMFGGSRITVGDRGNCSFVLLERLINCSHPASLLTELIVCVSVCMVKLLNNREHIFRGASRTYKIKIPVGLEGPAGRAGQTGRLAAWVHWLSGECSRATAGSRP